MSESSGWSCCPADVLLSIFRLLDDSSLSRCFEVNFWWRDTMDYFAKHYEKWPALAQNMMANNGSTFIRKSRLDWRELYINYRLWHHVQTAQITCNSEIALKNISYVHTYKDLITVVFKKHLQKPHICYLKINGTELKFVGKDTTTHDLEWPSLEHQGDDIESQCKNSSLANCLIKKMIQAGPFKRVATFQSHFIGLTSSLFYEDAFYALDKNNNLEVYILNSPNWFHCALARYYGQNETLDSLEGTDADVCVYLKNGMLMYLNRETKGFEQLGSYYRPHKWLHSEKICKAIMPDAKNFQTYQSYLKDYGKAPYSAAFEESGKQFVGLSTSQDEVRWVGEYPDLTSATQHGDMLLLGYMDGKIEIYQINFKVVADPSPPKLCFNIQDYATKDPSGKRDFRVIVIEVFEVKESHRLIIATPHAIYTLVITYPEHVKQSIGINLM